MSTKRPSQGGWTIWTMLLSASIVIVVALLILRLVPHYMDNHKLHQALEQIVQDPRVASLSRNQIIGDLNNILYIDYGADIVDLNESLSVNKEKGVVTISVEYEVVEHLVGNINALLEFNTTVDAAL